LGYLWLIHDLPSVHSLPQKVNTPSIRIIDRYGRVLYEELAEEGGRNTVVPLEQIPMSLRGATIATEDRNYYSHPGVDIRGILRALWFNLRGGETLSGGSTITQQLARNILLDESERFQRSLRRKLRESILAWKLTRQFTKDEILAFYLNQTYYGGMAYGVEAAAQTFFGKPVSELDLAESALLAGLPQAPASYNPFSNPERAKERQRIVLGLMKSGGWITEDQRNLAEREPLIYATTPYPIEAPHFIMMVREELDRLISDQSSGDGAGILGSNIVTRSQGLVVRTTLDLDWQKLAERAISQQLDYLQHSKDGMGHNVNNAALVAMDSGTGEILALVGSADYFDTEIAGAINMAVSPRQPGSALKPLVYAAALDPENVRGGWTTATMLLDVSTSFVTSDGKAYTPTNYDLKEHGPVLVREALASSLNIPAVITLDHVGLERLFELATKMGISTLDDPQQYDLSLALGGGSVSLYELTAAYGAFANGGYKVRPQVILEIHGFNDEMIFQNPAPPRVRVLDERVAWLISDILSDNDARRLGFGAHSILKMDFPAAVKTGTTSNFHDNWTVGYTPGLVVGVWSGNSDYQPMREINGLTGAAPIWHQFFRSVQSNKPHEAFLRPEGLEKHEICALSGLLPTEACQFRRFEWFISGTQPSKKDNLYRLVTIDDWTGSLANETTAAENQVVKTVLELPSQAQPWANEHGLSLYSDILSSDKGLVSFPISSTTSAPIFLVSPPQNSAFRLSTSTDSASQRLKIEAIGEPGLRQVSLWVDGERIASLTNVPYKAWWTLIAGVHQVWAEAIRNNGEWVKSEIIYLTVE